MFVTVSATRQGDEATTRAEFGADKKLHFTAGDQLFVTGSHDTAGKIAGTLDYDAVSGKFSGTITTENEYTGTIDDLLAGKNAALLPKDYESYEFLSVSGSGYNAELFVTPAKAFATTKAAAVEQFSRENGPYASGTGFTLAPLNAVLNFTIKGLAASTEVAVDFIGFGSIPGNVTTDGSGIATFAIGVSVVKDLIDCTLTVGGKAVTLVSSSKTLEAGHIYNITRTAGAVPVDLGLSVKWANMNVSFLTVGDNGFFAWGDTQGYRSVDASDYHEFSWEKYKWCNGTNITLTKYNNNSELGTVDDKVTLEAADDAATDNWGSLWRMPTAAEWEELLATKNNTTNYTWSWEAEDGLNGWRITRKSTGANIFLPAAGYRDETLTINDRGSVGNYWSSSLYESSAISARYFYFNSTEVEMRSVRAVLR